MKLEIHQTLQKDDLLPNDLQKKWKYFQKSFSCVYKIEVHKVAFIF